MSKSSRMVRGHQASVPVLDPDHVEEVEAAPLSEEAVMQGLAIAAGTAISQETPDSNSTAPVDSGSVGSPGEPPLVQGNVLATISHEMSSSNIECIGLSIPLVKSRPGDASYVTRRVDMRISTDQAKILRRLYLGLHQTHEKMSDGTHVDCPNDVVRWLLDSVEKYEASKLPPN